jgi:4-carboxymuconolactone decarboxylase
LTNMARIEPLPSEEWDDLLRALVDNSPGGTHRPLNIFTTLGRNPELFRKWLGFGGALLGGKLDERDRELLILRTAHRCHSDYEWVQHVPLAKAAGLGEEEIRWLAAPLEEGRWSHDDASLLRAADELHDEFGLSDETWAQLSSRFDPPRLIELVMLVGQYHLVALAVSALEIELEAP